MSPGRWKRKKEREKERKARKKERKAWETDRHASVGCRRTLKKEWKILEKERRLEGLILLM